MRRQRPQRPAEREGDLRVRAWIGRREPDRTRQPSGRRASRLAHAGRPEPLRKIATAETLRAAGAPDAPAMTDRLALRPHRSAERAETECQSAVMGATRVDHDGRKYGFP
jgi:hypothetical protein